MSDYRLTIKVQNNNVLGKIYEAGYTSVSDFCRRNKHLKINESHLGKIINMKTSPLGIKGDFLSIVRNCADALNCLPEHLFSEKQLETELETNISTYKLGEAELRFMLENHQEQKLLEDVIHTDEIIKSVDTALNTLKPREKKIIEMRMGIGEYEREHLRSEIAAELNISSARVMQIEQKALRKLRHPARATILKEHFNESI